MGEHVLEPKSRIVVTNPWSRALVPSEIYDQSFIEFAHESGAYLYLVLVGPRVDITGLEHGGGEWVMRTQFHNGTEMKPRSVSVPFEILPEHGTDLVNGAINFADNSGKARRANAVQVAREVLSAAVDRAMQPEGKLTAWEWDTLRKFFTYRVEYIGQSYGKEGSRTAAERIGEGHATVQAALAETQDHFPNSAVALTVMGVDTSLREMRGSIGVDTLEIMSGAANQMVFNPDGPLKDKAKLVTTMEAMLIRSFPEARNVQYKKFPLKDAPTLVKALRESGITHVGVQLDVRGAVALIQHPNTSKEASQVLRFDVDLESGESGTFPNDSPLTWLID